MSDLLKYGLLAAAGYLAYEYFFAPPASPPATPATTPGAPAAVSTPVLATSATPAAPAPAVKSTALSILNATNSQTVLGAAQAGGQLPASGLFNGWQWNWYMNQVTGIAPFDVASDMSQQMTFQQYWSALLSTAATRASQGLGRLGGYVYSVPDERFA
jgi:hypothetical protein